MARGVCWGLAVLLASAAAGAQPPRLDLELAAGAGIDANPCAAPSSETDAVPMGCAANQENDSFGLLEPLIALRWQRLSLQYEGSLRPYVDSGLAQRHAAALAIETAQGPVRAGLALRGFFSRFEAFPEERFLGGTAEANGAASRGILELRGRYRIGVRQFLATTARPDVDQWLSGALVVSPAPGVRFGAGAELRRRSTEEVDLSAWRVSGLAWTDLRWQRLSVRLDGELASRAFDDHRHDLEVMGSAVLSFRILGGLHLFVRGEVESVRSSDPDLSFVRPLAEAGLRWEASLPLGGPDLPPFQPRATERGRWLFRVHAPTARAVAILGTFNDWDPGRGALRRGRGGDWTGVLEVPPGRHLYQLLVDGAPREPPDAQGYASDGFGGTNGVLHAP